MHVVLCPEDKTFMIDADTCLSLIQTTDLFSAPTIKCFIINPAVLNKLGYKVDPNSEPVQGQSHTCHMNRERAAALFGVTDKTINLVVV